jgi:Right handed beta helix region
MPRRHVPALLSACLLPLSVSAATLRVPIDHPTIQAAVDAAGPGDVIQVAKGVYADAVVVEGKQQLTLRGTARPVLDGGGVAAPLTIADSSQITVDGFAFENAPAELIFITASSAVTVQRCSFENPTEDGDGIRVETSTDVAIQKNQFRDIGNDGVVFEEAVLPLVANALVSKNRFEQLGDEAIDATGSGHLIEKNRIARAERGIQLDVDASGATIEKNTVEDAEDTCIDVAGSDNVVVKNKVRRCGDEGIHFTGNGNRAERNKIDAPGDDGIDVESDGNQLIANKIKGAGGNGIEVVDEVDVPGAATGNLFEANKISGSTRRRRAPSSISSTTRSPARTSTRTTSSARSRSTRRERARRAGRHAPRRSSSAMMTRRTSLVPAPISISFVAR